MDPTAKDGREGENKKRRVDPTMGATTLADLPSEIRVHIVGFLRRPRDVLSCLAASPLLAARSPIEAAARWHAAGRHQRLLESGAPLDTVVRLFDAWGESPDTQSLVRAAARGGRADVVRWIIGDCACRGMLYATDDAASRGHVDVVRCLAHACRRQRWSWEDVHAPRMAIEAAHHDRLAVYSYIHDRLTHDGWQACVCCCPRGAADAALAAGSARVVAWMRAVGCDALPSGNSASLGEAIVAGHHATARWLTTTMPLSNRQRAAERAIDAIREDRAHASPLSPAADPCDPLRETLIEIVRHGHVDVLDWIAVHGARTDGEAEGVDVLDWITVHGPRTDGEAEGVGANVESPATPEVDPWLRHADAIAHEAAAEGRLDVVEWLLRHPRARRSVTADTARTAMRSGHVDVALALDRVGAVSMDSWDSLSAAVRSCSARAVHVASVHGGVYGPHVLAVAVQCATPEIVEFLCLRYGTADAQTAVDAAALCPHNPDAIARLRAIVDDLCVARVQSAAAADPEAPVLGWGDPCSCTVCSSPS